jgi:hypothetical protein
MVKVYFETTKNSYAELYAIFNNETDYVSLLPEIKKIQKERGFDILTEVVTEVSLEEFQAKMLVFYDELIKFKTIVNEKQIEDIIKKYDDIHEEVIDVSNYRFNEDCVWFKKDQIVSIVEILKYFNLDGLQALKESKTIVLL